MAKVKGKTPVSKSRIKRQVQKRGDQAPEAKADKTEASRAAQKLFDDADKAALAGLPEDMTNEQREKQLQRSALGY